MDALEGALALLVAVVISVVSAGIAYETAISRVTEECDAMGKTMLRKAVYECSAMSGEEP